MDAGVIAYLLLMFPGGLVISLALRMLVHSLRSWLLALLGGVVPPSLLLLVDGGTSFPQDLETLGATAIIWAAAFVPAFLGGVCGVAVGARARRRQEY